MTTVRVRSTGDPSIGAGLEASIDRELVAVAEEFQRLVVGEAKDNLVPHTKTGALSRSVTPGRVQVTGSSVTVEVGAGGQGAPYAAAMDQGSGLYGARGAKYPIRPKTPGGVLAWPAAMYGPPGGRFRRLSGAFKLPIARQIAAGTRIGAYVYARGVMHPGVKPTHFLTAAVAIVRERDLGRLLTAAIQRAMRST